MPQDRFIHPRFGHSEKVNQLTDLEFRAWATYLVTADDYGVMRASAVTLQAANDALSTKPVKVIDRCLKAFMDVGLLVDFHHQGRQYVCQLDWQKYQKVRWPRDSSNPVPPPEVIARCCEQTRALFEQRLSVPPVEAPKDSGETSEVVPAPARTGGREWLEASGKRLEANGLRERFADFWKVYPRKVGKDAAWKAWQKRKPDVETTLTVVAALAWQKQQDAWLREGGRYVPNPATWIHQGRWQDEPQETPRINDRTLATAHAVEEFLHDGQR